MTGSDFIRVDYGNPHLKRMREIQESHPEIKELFGYTPITALYAAALVLLQVGLGFYLRQSSWWVILLVSYLIGAVANHALFVIIHECTHNLVFKSIVGNRLCGIFSNLGQFVPSAIPFAKYHTLHHTNQAEYDFDADLAGPQEARWVGNSWWKKLLSIFFFSFVQGFLRPLRLKKVDFWDRWYVLNFIVQFVFLGCFAYFAGLKGLVYLALSTFFGIGLHPLGGRWIQEHYVLQESKQETYSYYGPLNKLCFNMGFHNEHHDFTRVPWSRLPQVKKIAPEYYDSLISYRSWTWVLWKFIFDPQISLYQRVVRPSRSRAQNALGDRTTPTEAAPTPLATECPSL